MTPEEQNAYNEALRRIEECRSRGKDGTNLNLSKLGLITLPPEIGKLSALTRLFLNNNRLSSLPPEIGQLSALTELYLSRNHLDSIPPEIGALTALTQLELCYNQLSSLPPEIGQLSTLKWLDLSHNHLSALPPEIAHLSTLTYLFLQVNPALGIPKPVLGPSADEVYLDKTPARSQDILGFYFSQVQGKAAGTLRRVNELKVMLVGQGGAGKTSFRRFFMGEEHVRGEKETPGIALGGFKLVLGEEIIQVRLWDFAGQEITHALHRFFLAEGCVYILVVDPRSDAEEENAKYWLGLLNRYAKDAPVIIAMNQQDERQGGYDLPRREFKAAYPSIHSFHSTNCATRVGCPEVLFALRQAVAALAPTEPPHLEIPGPWKAAMTACDDERFKKKPHLSLKEFREICASKGEKDQAAQERLARLLHKLGAVLHFVDEPRLRDTAVLDPHWVTDGVYRLLRYKDGPGSDGTLTLADARKALPGKSEKDARYLLRLMERFEMCFPLEEDPEKLAGKWLIPGALAKFQPDTVDTAWDSPGAVRIRYLYEPLPEGVLPRFITMTHLMSEEQPRWRNGVVLQSGNTAALVRRGLNRNHVEIAAFGPDIERLRLLEIIQGNFERIHRDLPEPKPVAQIEIPGTPGVYRSLEDIKAAELQEVPVAVQVDQGGEQLQLDPTSVLNRTSDQQSRTSQRLPLNAFLSYSHKDKRAKNIFGDNLAIMTSKRLISTWEDGLIEPGSLWREAIQDALERMDVFIGLLTSAFLASDFIQSVELAAARKRLAMQDRTFVFILILVDDISLEGFDLSQYQILKPGGKAVSLHKNTKAGLDAAQKEIEKLILTQQENKREPRMEWETRRHEHIMPKSPGVTIVVQGDYHLGDKFMNDDHSTNISGNNYGQVGQTLTNCTNMIQQQAPGERKNLLEELDRQVRLLISQLPEETKAETVSKIEKNLKVLVEEATSQTPDRAWYEVSTKGLLEASKSVKDFTGNIAGTLKNLGKLVVGIE